MGSTRACSLTEIPVRWTSPAIENAVVPLFPRPWPGVRADPDDEILDGVPLLVRDARHGRSELLGELGKTLIDLDGRLTPTSACQALAIVSAAPRLVLRLDKDARTAYWVSSSNWVDRARRRLDDGGVIAAALASMHGDGRVRESAVTRMVELARPETGPFMVLRTTDWVSQVRSRARAGLTALLHDAPLAWFPVVAPTTFLLSGRGRASAVLQHVNAELWATPEARLRELVGHADRTVGRVAFDIALARRVYRTRDLVTIAVEHSDRPVASRAADAAARDAVWTGNRTVLDSLIRARATQVRALGLTGLVRAGYPQAATEYLADSAALVRSIARDAVRRNGSDPVAWYRATLAGDAASPGALAGLAECGTSSDGALLERYLDHPAARMRAAAVSALREVSAVRPPRVAPLLHDPSARVVRQVVAALRPHATALAPDPLWHLLADPHRHARRAAYGLLRQRAGWPRLLVALLAVTDTDTALARRARTDAVAWARHEPDPPDSPPTELAALTENVRAVLGESIASILRARMRTEDRQR